MHDAVTVGALTRIPVEVRTARPDELAVILDLVRRSFPPGDEADVLVAATVQNDPRFRREHLRVALRDGAIVGVINIIDRLVRVGTAQVRCAIVAPLATDPAHQGTGVGSALMRTTLDWARQNAFQLSMLWGHTWLYPRYGYAPGIKSYEVVMPASLQPVGDAAYTLRPYAPADAPALLQVYHAETATTTLAELRGDAPWEWRPHRPETSVEVAVDPARAVRGYMRVRPQGNTLHVGEIVALDAGAAQALYDRLLHLAREHGAATVHVVATPDNRWSRLAFARGAKVCIGSGGGAGMVRVLDWPALLQTLAPELERRLASTDYVIRRIDLRLETPVGRATVQIDRGQVRVSDAASANLVTLPFHALGPLVSGYRTMYDLEGQPGVFVRGERAEALRALDQLFPEGYPHWPFAAYFN